MKKDKKPEEKNKLQPPRLNLSAEAKRGIAVVVFATLAVITFLAVVELAGSLGAALLSGLKWIFGVLAYFVPIFLLLIAWLLANHRMPQDDEDRGEDRGFYWRVYLGSLLMLGSIAGLVHIFYLKNGSTAWDLVAAGKGGGFLGAGFGGAAFGLLDFWAGGSLLLAALVIGALMAFNAPLHKLWSKGRAQQPEEAEKKTKPGEVKINAMASEGFVSNKVLDRNKKLKEGLDEGEVSVPEPVREKLETKIINAGGASKAIELDAVKVDNKIDYKLPSFDLLEQGASEVDSGNIEVNIEIIRKTLADFGIEVEMGEVNVGPTVTQYTLRPATGVRLNQIAALQNDLALALSAHSIRMELPIPGKALVGIEVPNKSTAIVRLRDVMQTQEFVNHKSKLAFALGRDVAGHTMVADLAKMPHLLIAGATGTGKSVGINSLLISLLFRNTPQDVKFIVVDPKRVELNLYNGIPHLLTPVVIDHEKAVNALKWAVSEMERRYKLLSEVGKRNIIEYNESNELKMHYIVIIVDELADTTLFRSADVEAAIVRLAQMARAVGIHLVLATQRPSVEIITGLIKANITSRIAFAVASQIDSRTILDGSGAEKLLGNGDLLFTSAEFNKPKRVQGAYIGEKEVKKVVDFFKNQAGAVIYNEEILEKPKKSMGIPGFEGDEDADPLFEEAKEEVQRMGKASTTLLQRRLRIGYARAARIMDMLEQAQIIGPGEGAKPREVYGAIPQAEKAEYGVEEDSEEV
ncbi:MAG: DNA translocase FtsK [Patescibacteria group bacterium]|nr:DNA translocase FtsK [Patescibacteria group bacterium]